jgi:hypothetical protein
MRILRLGLAAALLAALTACSPYTYSQEVADMNTSVKKLEASVTSGHQAVVDDQAAHYRRMLIETRAPVALATNCFRSPPGVAPYVTPTPDEKAARAKQEPGIDKPQPRQPCDVYLPRDNDKPFADPAPIPAELDRAMKALGDYMGSLAAVTNATDRTNFDAAYGKLATSVSGILAAAGAAAPVAAIAGAGINVFGWLLGNGLDIQRFQALKAAVNAVDKPVREGGSKAFFIVVQTIAQEVNALSATRRQGLVKAMLAERAKLGPGIGEDAYRARLADIQAMAVVIEGLYQAGDAQAAANALMAAHDKLVDAVNNPTLDIADLISTIGALKDKVSALQSALAAASAPPTTVKKGS